MCLDKTVRCVARAVVDEERNKNVTSLPNMFSRLGVEVLADVETQRLYYEGCAPSFRRVHLRRMLPKDGAQNL